MTFLHNLFNHGNSKAQAQAQSLSQAQLRISTLLLENETLHQRIKEESQSRISAITSSLKYQSLAEEWQAKYTLAVESHISSLKSETNWFAMSTSTRLPMHDGVGPTRPVPRDEATDTVPITPKRLSTIAKEETRRTLDNVSSIQTELLKKLSKDVTSLEPVNLDLTESAAKLYHDQWGEWPKWYSPTPTMAEVTDATG